MNIKVKNYVILESKTFTYTLKNVCVNDLLDVFACLLKTGIMFDYKTNSKSNTLSFYVRSIDEFNNVKRFLKKVCS